MAEQVDGLRKLVTIATDLGLPVELRTEAVEQISGIGTRDALLALLGLAANEKLTKGDRELAIKYAREIIRSGR
ncbi:hypothetical protein ACFLYG_03285 [Chloroflexota bacterium]